MNFDVLYTKTKSIPSNEMHEFFRSRSLKHIYMVQDAIYHISWRFPRLKTELDARGRIHDHGKFEEPELSTYVWITWFYKLKAAGIEFIYPIDIINRVPIVTQYHVKHNRHHPEFHYDGPIGISSVDRDKSDFAIDASKMNKVDIAEMVADWVSVAKERGANSAREWFELCSKTRWTFHEEQLEFINDLLKIFEE